MIKLYLKIMTLKYFKNSLMILKIVNHENISTTTKILYNL